MSAWWLLTFTASDIKDKVIYLDGVEFLYDNMSADSMDLPPFIFEIDKQVRGYANLCQSYTCTFLKAVAKL